MFPGYLAHSQVVVRLHLVAVRCEGVLRTKFPGMNAKDIILHQCKAPAHATSAAKPELLKCPQFSKDQARVR